MASGNPHFFWDRNFFCRKNFAAKVENLKKFPVEILKIQKNAGRKFVRPKFSGRKSKLPGKFWNR